MSDNLEGRTHFYGDSCPGGHYGESTDDMRDGGPVEKAPEPKWVIDPEAIKRMKVSLSKTGTNGSPLGSHWQIGGAGYNSGLLISPPDASYSPYDLGWLVANVTNYLPALLRLIELADAMAYETWESCAFDCKCCAGCRAAVEKYWEARGER